MISDKDNTTWNSFFVRNNLENGSETRLLKSFVIEYN